MYRKVVACRWSSPWCQCHFQFVWHLTPDLSTTFDKICCWTPLNTCYRLVWVCFCQADCTKKTRELCHWGTCPSDSIATLVNSLQNRVNSITQCITLNATTGKIVLVTLCIQTDWLFWTFVWCVTVPWCLSIDRWTALGCHSAIFSPSGIRTPALRQSSVSQVCYDSATRSPIWFFISRKAPKDR